MNVLLKVLFQVKAALCLIYFVLLGILTVFVLFACYLLPALTRNKLAQVVISYYYLQLAWCTEVWNGIEIVFTGDELPMDENALVVMNHLTSSDPFYLFCLGLRMHRLGEIKFFTKNEIKYYFPFGTGMWCARNIFVNRNWNDDDGRITEAFSDFQKYPNDPLWIMIFLEGRRYNKKLHAEAVEFCERKGLRPPKHTLMPRVKGFCATLQGAGNLLNAVYDVTIAYEPEIPDIVMFGSGYGCRKIHINIKRHPMETFKDKNEDELRTFVYDMWSKKDELLDSFYKTNKFPNKITSYSRPWNFSDVLSCFTDPWKTSVKGSGIKITRTPVPSPTRDAEENKNELKSKTNSKKKPKKLE